MANTTIPNIRSQKYIFLRDVNGGESYKIPVTIDANGNLVFPVTAISAAGVIPYTDKNFLTDSQLASAIKDETWLSTTDLVNVNTATATTLFTVPAGKTCYPSVIVIRNASTSLTTASFGIGFNTGTNNDVLASATHTELTGSTLFTRLGVKTGAKVGAAGDILALKCTVLQGGAATISVDVYGSVF